jgi:hypothetical protein
VLQNIATITTSLKLTLVLAQALTHLLALIKFLAFHFALSIIMAIEFNTFYKHRHLYFAKAISIISSAKTQIFIIIVTAIASLLVLGIRLYLTQTLLPIKEHFVLLAITYAIVIAMIKYATLFSLQIFRALYAEL